MTARHTRRRVALFSAGLILALAWPSAAATEPRHALLLHSFEPDFAPYDAFAGLFRTELSRRSGEPVDLVEFSMQPARFVRSPDEDAFVSYLRATLAGRRLDLVVSIGGPAAVFAQKHRQQLFPTTPLVLAAVDQRFVQDGTLTPNDTAVAVDNNPTQLVESILGLLPETTNVFAVIGTSELEQFWRDEMSRASQHFKDRVTFIWSNELSFKDILVRSAALPPHSAIFYVLMSIDAEGVPQVEARALAELHAVANAPIFGLHSSQLGRGIVGGPVISIDGLSRDTVDVALRILHGESPATIRPAVRVAGPPMFDWRELRRWGIDADRLPTGSVVMFREPTAWDQYRWQILSAVSIVLVEGLLVLGLVVNQVKRRRAEYALHESEQRFRLMSNAAPVMVWIAGPDMQCIDVNRPWLEFTGRTIDAELGEGWAEGVHPDDLNHCLETYRRAFDQREPFRIKYRLRRHDGEYRWILHTGVPRLTSAGGLAGYIGSAIDVTELNQARTALSSLSQRLMEAHEQERSLIARELHDDVGQRLAGLTMQLHALSQNLADGDNNAKARMRDLCADFSDLGKDIHTLVRGLHSSTLDHLGLPVAAGRLCKEVATQYAVKIDFVHDGVPDLPQEIALGLFRVLQEALSNAVRHSGVRKITVALRGSRNEIQLEVIDLGAGFDLGATMSHQGLGLISMRERLALINGSLHIDSRPGAGTTVRAVVPLVHNDERASTHRAVSDSARLGIM